MAQTIVITGAGRGIGRVLAEGLLEDGHNVVATALRHPEEVEALAQRASKRVVALQADVTSEWDCQQVVDEAWARFGRIDGLINNAGRGMVEISPDFNTEPTEFWRTDAAQWRALFEVNVHGVFAMTRAVVPALMESKGVVLNVSTSPRTMVRRGYTPYGPTKAALEAMSAAWAEELLPHGVRLNVVLPGGATDTAFVPGHGAERRGADGMLLSPELMLAPVRFLLSDRALDLTGRRFVAREFDPEAAFDAPRLADGIAVPSSRAP